MVTKLFKGLIATTLGLTMVLGVGIGIANNTKESPVYATNGDVLQTADFTGGSDPSGWTVNGNGYYSGNGLKFTATNHYVISPSIASSNLKDVKVGIKAGYNGDSGSVLTVSALDSNDNVLSGGTVSGTITPNQTYTTSVSNLNEQFVELSTNDNIAKIKIALTAKTSNIGLKIVNVYDNSTGGGQEPPASTFTVTYVNGGALSGTVPEDDTEYESNAEVTVLGNVGNLEKTNYVFAGWTDGVQTFNAGDTFNINSNKILTAVWNYYRHYDDNTSLNTITWDLSNPEYLTASTSQMSWGSPKVTMVVDKASASTNTNNFCPPSQPSTRFYKNSTLSISPVDGYQINSVVFTAGTDGYATALANSTWANASAVANGTSVTITPEDRRTAISATIGNTTGHTQVVVNYSVVTSEPSVDLSTNSLNLKTNQENGATVTATVDNIESPTYLWTTVDSNITLENETTATVTIKPHTNQNGSATVALTVGGLNGGNPIEPISRNLTVNLSVPEPGETAGTAYSIAEAVERIDTVGDENNVYVRGIISQVDSYNSTYHSITYWISDDGSTSNQFEVYGGKGLNNANFSSKEDIETGATVIVYGNITKHNTTYEFSSNNYQVSYTAAPRYTVSFNSLGGNDIDAISNIKKGNSIATLPTAAKANDAVNQKRFVFDGWFTVANPENPVFEEENRFTTSTAVNSNMTVYAKYTEISYYVVSFNTNGGNTIAARNVDANSVLSLPDDPIKVDALYTYTFEGWYKNDGLTEEFDDSEHINSNMTLFAKYTAQAISNPVSYLNYAESTCTLHGNEITAGSGTTTKTINALTDDNNWTVSAGQNVTCYTSFDMNEIISISTTGTPNCGSVWGSTTKDWRLYQNQKGNIVITANDGYNLSSVTITYNISNTGTLKYGNDTVASATPFDVSGSSITFTVGNTAEASNGQVRITAISVSYERAYTVSGVAIRFGASIPKSAWDAINDNFEDISDYGVMLMTDADLEAGNYNSIQEAYEDGVGAPTMKIFNKCAGGAPFAVPYLDGENYIFKIVLCFPADKNYYDDEIHAVPFVVVGDQYYFLDEMNESVLSLATAFRNSGNYALLSDEALQYLMN